MKKIAIPILKGSPVGNTENVIPILKDSPSQNTETAITFELPRPEDQAKTVELVQVSKPELEGLIQQNFTQKQEIGVLVSVFSQFQGFFDGKSNTLQMVGTITKLMTSKEVAKSLEVVFPILEKYNGKNQS